MKRDLRHLSSLLVVGAFGSLVAVACGDKNTNITSHGGGESGAAGSAGSPGGASGSSGSAGSGGTSGTAGSAGAQAGAAGTAGSSGSAGTAGAAGSGGSAGVAGSAGAALTVVQIATGSNSGHTCARLSNGRLRCWGRNNAGQLGYGHVSNIGDDEAPRSQGDVDVGGEAVQVAAGHDHTCALLVSGAVRCWGANLYGQLGYGHTEAVGDTEKPSAAGNVQLQLDAGDEVAEIVPGSWHTCVLTKNGKVMCWGLNDHGQCGYGVSMTIGDNETAAAAPTTTVGGKVAQLVAGNKHTCARFVGGSVQCWGEGAVGALGYGNSEDIGDDETPASAGSIVLGAAAKSIAAGGSHSCAILTTGQARCWGLGAFGRLGIGSTVTIGDDEVPTQVAPINFGESLSIAGLSAGGHHTCIRTASGSARCWGYGGDGSLGNSSPHPVGDEISENPLPKVNIPIGDAIEQIVAGGGHTCVIAQGGKGVRCWGYANEGTLGYGNTVQYGLAFAPSAAGSIDLF